MKAKQGKENCGAVLVVGGGAAGLQAAVEVVSAGHRVYLVEQAPRLGGLMPQLDKTFPTNDCAMCFIAPKEEDRSGCLRGGVAVWRHPGVEVLAPAEVLAVEGEAGRFRARVLTRPLGIEPATCTACGKCAEVCPERAVSEFNAGLAQHAAAYLTYPQAVPRTYVIDRAACTNCGLCVEACPVQAVVLDEQGQERELSVGAVILAVGNNVFQPGQLKQYLYGQHPNVMTGLEYERLYSGTGPFQGRLARPSDGAAPGRIAWLQCIGSRDVHTHSYCSSVCCMYAMKEAMIAKESLPGVEAAIFYMDIRACGKDYEQYYQRARQEYGVRFICYRVPEIFPAADGDLRIDYFDAEGKKQSEIFNLVVLATGFEVSAGARELAARLGLELDRHHYPRTDPWVPVATNRPGVYGCGTFPGPKDIPESITEASAAAALSLTWLGGARPPEEESSPPVPAGRAGVGRVGMVFCGWGPELTEVVDLAAVKAEAASLPGVALTVEQPLACTAEGLARLAQEATAQVDRVVVAAGAPWVQERQIREIFVRAGFNQYLVEVVNIRSDAAWVHAGDRAGATARARERLRAAAARVRSLEPLADRRLAVEPRALVVGGGVAGLSAALNLAQQGFEVCLVEKDKELGGWARRLARTIEGLSVREYLDRLVGEVTSQERIEVLRESEIIRHQGRQGNFLTTVATGPERRERSVRHGAVIVATGAVEYRPREYLYGSHPGVMTQMELAARLEAEPELAAGWKRVAMIQCVGSRNAANPTCSRICCQTAVKHALQLKEMAPELDVVVLHRDLRLYGLLEDYYVAARDRRVLFERYDPARPPEVREEGGKLQVAFWEPILQREVQWPVEAVILSAATQAADTAALANILNLEQDERGFFRELHPKMRPLDAMREGYYLCGTAQGPKLLKEAVTQGLGAAVRAGAFLTGRQIISPVVAAVEQGQCVGCLACVRTCPYQVPRVEQGRSEIDPAICLGCGICAGVCPAGAIRFAHYRDEQLQVEMGA